MRRSIQCSCFRQTSQRTKYANFWLDLAILIGHLTDLFSKSGQIALQSIGLALLNYLVKLLKTQVFLMPLGASSLCQICGSRTTSCRQAACSPPLGLSAPVAPQGRADSTAARNLDGHKKSEDNDGAARGGCSYIINICILYLSLSLSRAFL